MTLLLSKIRRTILSPFVIGTVLTRKSIECVLEITSFSRPSCGTRFSEISSREITLMREVVEIPGFRNFFDFSTEFAKEVQVELNAWQIRDGFIFQQWVRGLSGKSSMPSEELAEHMDAIYSDFKTHAPGLWVMAQMKGIT